MPIRRIEPAVEGVYVLYRFYSAKGQLLYVGITTNPPRRFKAHRNGKWWWGQVRGITLEHYPNGLELRAAERLAIRVERPMYNMTYSSGRMFTDDAGGESRTGYVRDCEFCGNRFISRYPTARFCCRSCRGKKQNPKGTRAPFAVDIDRQG